MRCAQSRVQPGRRAFLDQLLEAALDRAFALAQVDDVPVAVAEHLHFDVARPFDETFGKQAAVAEVALALAAGGGNGIGQGRSVAHDLHALAATAGGALDQQRKAQFPRALGKGCGVVGLVGRGRDRHALRHRKAARADLVSHQLDGCGVGADEDQAGVGHCTREACVLGQEAVARVQRVATRFARGADHAGAVQPGRHRRFTEDLHGLIGFLQGRSMAILGVPGHDGGHAQPPRAAHDAQRDLRTVGDEEFADRRHGLRRRAGWDVARTGSDAARGVDTSCSSRATRCSSAVLAALGAAPRMPPSTNSV